MVHLAQHQCLRQRAQAQGGGVGLGVVVRQVGLGQAQHPHGVGLGQRGQGHGQVAHEGAVAAITLVGRASQAAVQYETLYAPAASGPAVHRLGPPPAHKGVADAAGDRIECGGQRGGGVGCWACRHRPGLLNGRLHPLWSRIEQCLAQHQAHGGVVGHLAWRQLEPAAAHDVAVRAVALLYFAWPHEFDRGPQGIAHGQAQVGTQGAVPAAVRKRHHWPPRHSGRPGPAPLARLAAPGRAAGLGR